MEHPAFWILLEHHWRWTLHLSPALFCLCPPPALPSRILQGPNPHGGAGPAPALGPPSAGFGEGVSVKGWGCGGVLSQINSSGYSWVLYSPGGLWRELLPYKITKLEAPCRRNTYSIYMCFTVEFLCINAQYIDIYCENSCFINMELFCFLDLCQFPINTEIR